MPCPVRRKGRRHIRADLFCDRATRSETASAWRIDRTRRLAGERQVLTLSLRLRVGNGHCRNQISRVGMQRCREQVFGRRNLDLLRQQLGALNRPRLLNIIAAYDLNPAGEDLSWMTDSQLVTFIVTATDVQLLRSVR